MKIIDLLNKIANGEEVPKKIKCDGSIYDYEFQNTITGAYEYRNNYGQCIMNNMAGHLYLTDILNNEVEIIKEEKEIDKIPYHYNLGYIDCGDLTREVIEELTKNMNCFTDKINELIDEINKLKEDK